MEMKDTVLEKGVAGFLEIFVRKDGGPWQLHTADSNVILDNYRINAANMAVDNDGYYNDSGNRMAEDLIPNSIWLDNEGSNILQDGSELIITPNGSTEVSTSNPDFYSHLIDQKDISEVQPNIAVFRVHIQKSEGNGKTFSRATLKSISGESIATKCFESILKKETWDVYFKWSIAY
jgi:hypothetical protein